MKPFRIAYSPELTPSPLRFHVHVIGYRMRMKETVNAPRGSGCHFLFFFHDRVTLGTRDGVVEAPAHTFLISPPYAPIYHDGLDRSWRRSWLRCSGTGVPSLLEHSGVPVNTPVLLPDASLVDTWLLRLHEEMHHPRGAMSENVEDLFSLWMRSIVRDSVTAARSAVPEPVLLARQYLETHYQNPVALDELARICHFSRAHLCREFRKHVGYSPTEYAISLRVQHAAELLENLTLTLDAVAQASGFRDVYYFSRVFRKHMGLPPGAYRQKLTMPPIIVDS